MHRSPRADDGTNEYIEVGGPISLCQIDTFERSAPVLAAGAMEVPATILPLQRIAMAEGIEVARPVIVGFQFGEPIGDSVHQEISGIEQSPDDL